MKITNTAFLCGYFSANCPVKGLKEGGWVKRTYTEEDVIKLQNYYFPEFAQCMADEITLYSMPIHNACSLDFNGEKVPFLIEEIRLWEAPFHIVLYAVKLRFEEVEFNSVTWALNSLRNFVFYRDMHRPFMDAALYPIIEIYNKTMDTHESFDKDISWLAESGNKFKIFQILKTAEPIEQGDEQLLIYDAATLAAHTPHSTGINSPTYVQHVLDEHYISVFSGWSGIALLDTFTLMTTDTPEWVIANWEKDYFDKIYIYQLFRKVFLYSVNLHYRRRTEDVLELEKKLSLFEQNHSYPAISYNFLPNIINSAIEKSLNTQRDYDQLNRMINKELDIRRNQAEEKTNHFLTFLTCLTLFSAIYDAASLFNDSFGYADVFPSDHFGFRFVSTILLAVVLIIYLILNKKK